MSDGTRADLHEEVYRLLEEKMMSHQDYAGTPVAPEEDEVGLVVLKASAVLSVRPTANGDVRPPEQGLLLRAPAADRLYWAGQEIKSTDRELQLEVLGGYWSPEDHQRLFDTSKAAISGQYDSEDDLLAATHRRVAMPDVAGHPTGGAVDVRLLRAGEPIDMGTELWDYSRDSFTFSPFVDRSAWEARQLLRRAMMAAGFAPYDGEWWHFSYGTKEWAHFYDRSEALYGAIPAGDVHLRMATDTLT